MIMRYLLPLLACLAATPPSADPSHTAGSAQVSGARLPDLDLPDIAARIAARYRGRLLSVQLDDPRPHERDLGVRTVYVAEFLTLADNRLTLRLDGDNGMFLLIDGAGQTQARIRP